MTKETALRIYPVFHFGAPGKCISALPEGRQGARSFSSFTWRLLGRLRSIGRYYTLAWAGLRVIALSMGGPIENVGILAYIFFLLTYPLSRRRRCGGDTQMF
jgi:hypothetical protein